MCFTLKGLTLQTFTYSPGDYECTMNAGQVEILVLI